jgi:hypothetical protein
MEKESRLEYPVFLLAANKQASRGCFFFFRCLKEEGRRSERRREGGGERRSNRSRKLAEAKSEREEKKRNTTNARTHAPDGKESRSEDEWLVQIQETDTQFLRWTKAPW